MDNKTKYRAVLLGDRREEAKRAGYEATYSEWLGATGVIIPARNQDEATDIAWELGEVRNVFRDED